jgi:hypothetical protein
MKYSKLSPFAVLAFFKNPTQGKNAKHEFKTLWAGGGEEGVSGTKDT